MEEDGCHEWTDWWFFQQDQETRVQCWRITEQYRDVVYWNSHRSVEAVRGCSMYNVHIRKTVVVASKIIVPLTVSAYQPIHSS